jgi:predicted  nucleic acid-binding Zn-ribbon protein
MNATHNSKEKVMTTRDEYVRKMHSLLDKGKAEIDALEERAEHVEAEARDAYHKQIEALRAKQDEAGAKLDALRGAGEGAWQDLKAGVELAWEAIGEAIESAKSRIKK